MRSNKLTTRRAWVGCAEDWWTNHRKYYWVTPYSRVANTITMVIVLLHIRLAIKYHIRLSCLQMSLTITSSESKRSCWPALLRAVYIIIIVICIMHISTDIRLRNQVIVIEVRRQRPERHMEYTLGKITVLISRNVLTNINCHHHHRHHNQDDWHRHQL